MAILRRTHDDEWCQAERLERSIGKDAFRISEYKPRIEDLFFRIEICINVRSKESYWRIISSENVTSLYGEKSDSRIFDPAKPGCVFGWLLSQKFDDKDDAAYYQYKAENAQVVNLHQAYERYPSEASRRVARYPKCIRYGNRRPRHCDTCLKDTQWMFEVVFDYGEHDPDRPTTAELRP